MLSSGTEAGTRHLLPRVFQCTHRSLLGNRPACHLTVAILVALGNEAFRGTHPVLPTKTVSGVHVAAVVHLEVVLVEPDVAQSAKLEVQQRLWPRCVCATPAAPTGVEGQ